MHPAQCRMPLSLLSVAMMAGCGCNPSKTVYVSDGEPMRLAEPVKARVWVDSDGDGVLEMTNNRVTLPEGWWVDPPAKPNDPADYPTGATPPATRPSRG